MAVSSAAKARLASFLTPIGSPAGQQTTLGDNKMSHDNKEGNGIQGAARISSDRARRKTGRHYLQEDEARTNRILESPSWRFQNLAKPAPAARTDQPAQPAQEPATTSWKTLNAPFNCEVNPWKSLARSCPAPPSPVSETSTTTSSWDESDNSDTEPETPRLSHFAKPESSASPWEWKVLLPPVGSYAA